MGDSSDSSTHNIPQTGNKALPFLTSINQQSLTQQSPYHLTSELSQEHLSSQHQVTQCLHVTHNTVRRLRQTLCFVSLDQKVLPILTSFLENEFTLLHYLLLSRTFPPPQANILHALSSSSANQRTAFPPKASFDPKNCIFMPEGCPIKSLETLADSSLSTDPLHNPENKLLATTRDLQSRLTKLEALFGGKVASYTSITSGIHSQYVFLEINFFN